MRKALLFLLMLLALLLCACTRETHPSVYEVEQNGRVYTVDRENGVLTWARHTNIVSIRMGVLRFSIRTARLSGGQ